MRNILIILIMIAGFYGTTPGAGEEFRTGDGYFHGASAKFIGGDTPGALLLAQEGLRKFPNHEKLNGLTKILEQKQPPPDQNQQQDQQNQDQEQQENQEKEKSQSEQDQENQQDQQDQQENQEQQDNQDQEQQEENQDSGDNQEEEPQNQPEEQQPPENTEPDSQAVGKLTPEQARQLLESYEDEEKKLQKRKLGKPKSSQSPQDW